MSKRDALPLDGIHTHGCRIQQYIHDVIVEQVDLVNVEQAAIGCCQHARFETPFPFLDRLLNIQRAYYPVLGG